MIEQVSITASYMISSSGLTQYSPSRGYTYRITGGNGLLTTIG